jgi:UDP-N-acetylmuramate dehydrogenase
MRSQLINNSLKSEISLRYSGSVRFDVLLSEISRWKIGGIADVVISPKTHEELADLRGWLYRNGLPWVVIGATSNLLFSDEGLNAIAIQIGSAFEGIRIDDCRIVAQSGTWVPGLSRKAMLAGLSGLEHACGIPGTLGGLIYMNGGSQRKGIGDHIYYVKSVDVEGREVVRSQQECQFTYRNSVFQKLNEIIIEAGLKLNIADERKEIRSNMLHILRERRKKFPQRVPNCGSVFVSNPAMYDLVGPPGKAIESCGCKGLVVGGAQVSMLHANFIVNRGGAKASDVLQLIEVVGNKVYAETGFVMQVEAKYVSRTGEVQDITFV